ncbi:phage portal protein [Clostridium sp. ZBS18]|uniref:phage portal protein n=1 Tax=Clostridium sp. ZBS18 TaxID=2949967 RepID=UPI002079B97D|nr:phage portal protein [Clostridium sp. ZBS18]
MGFLMETRAEDNQTVMQKLFGAGNLSDINVTRDNILSISAISSAIELISSTISTLDFKLYKKINKTKVEEIEVDNRLYLLNVEPNYLFNCVQLKKAMIQDLILDGNTYVNIEKSKNKNEFERLNYLECRNVSVMLDTEPIHKDAKLMVQGKEYEVYDFIIATLNTKDGVNGRGILKNNRDLLALALLVQTYLNKNFKSGGGRKGVWQSTKHLGIEEFKQFKQDSKDIQETDEPIILNKELSYTPLPNTNRDMQILEIKKFISEELRSIFNIPERLDNDGFKSFIKIVLNPIINSLEGAINKALLLEDEKKQGYFFKLDVNELTRADIDTRFLAYRTSLDSGIESVNEIRMKENLEPVEGMDIHKMTIGQALYNSKNGTWFIPNTGVTSKDGEVINIEDNKQSKSKDTGKIGKDKTDIQKEKVQDN